MVNSLSSLCNLIDIMKTIIAKLKYCGNHLLLLQSFFDFFPILDLIQIEWNYGSHPITLSISLNVSISFVEKRGKKQPFIITLQQYSANVSMNKSLSLSL